MTITCERYRKGKYILNGNVIISNMDNAHNKVTYDISYDSDKLSNLEAISICEQFISETITAHNKNQN